MFSFVRTNRQTDSHNKDKQLNVLKGASKTNPSALSFFFYKTLRKVSSFWTVCRLIYIENSGFWEGILAQIPGARRGFWKSPRARRAARGDFQNPRTGDGDLGKIHDHKPEFCTYFFLKPGDIKTFSIYPITLHLYMDEYTLLKKYLDSLCLAEVFIIKFTVTKTLFENWYHSP